MEDVGRPEIREISSLQDNRRQTILATALDIFGEKGSAYLNLMRIIISESTYFPNVGDQFFDEIIVLISSRFSGGNKIKDYI